MTKSEESESELYETTLELLNKTPSGIAQCTLWKQLNIDSRKCTRIVKKLLDDGKITREPSASNGSRTFLIRSVGVEIPEPVVIEKPAHELNTKYDLLFNSNNEFEPCVSCTHDCTPSCCIPLGKWIGTL